MNSIDFSAQIAAIKEGNGVSIMLALIQAKQQYQIYHWQTTSYAEHKAFDSIYDSLGDLVDKFMEVYMGKYGRVIPSKSIAVNVNNYSQEAAIKTTNDFIGFLTITLPSLLKNQDTDLLNIRDEILGELNQLKYLLTLK